jgi:hypothetical protein
MTLQLLIKANPDYRQVVPTVIRHAERLGFYANHMLKKEGELELDRMAFLAVEGLGEFFDRLIHREKYPETCQSNPTRSEKEPVQRGAPRAEKIQSASGEDKTSRKCCYVIIDGRENGEQVFVIPWSTELTVRNSLQHQAVEKLIPPGAKVWISRPDEQGSRHPIMPVEWRIVMNDHNHPTNHRLQAGDRVYVLPIQPYAGRR